MVKYICLHGMMGPEAPRGRKEISARSEPLGVARLMAHLAEIAPIEESNIKLLKERIVELLACYECTEWARVLRTVERHREIRAGRSRRISDTERAWADTARRCLAAELAAVLERPQAEVEEQIDRCIEASR